VRVVKDIIAKNISNTSDSGNNMGEGWLKRSRGFEGVTAALVSFHVASDTESLSTTLVRTSEGFLASVRVAVDAKRAGPAKCFVACLADVAVLGLRE